MTRSSVDSRLILREDIVVEKVSGETVVLDLESNKLLGINDAARLILAFLRSGTTRGELIDKLSKEFEISRELASRDVDAFLSELRARDMLRGDDPV